MLLCEYIQCLCGAAVCTDVSLHNQRNQLPHNEDLGIYTELQLETEKLSGEHRESRKSKVQVVFLRPILRKKKKKKSTNAYALQFKHGHVQRRSI